jgi:non-ribosomal peptide synthase protein (TIGR01720 family)
VGFGLLRYLARHERIRELAAAPTQGQVVFTCTAQAANASAETGVVLQSIPTGPNHSPDAIRSHVLEFVAGVADGRLSLHLVFSGNLHRHSTIDAFAQRMINALDALIENCVVRSTSGYKPSDFPAMKMSQEELDNLIADLNTSVASTASGDEQ